MNLIFKTLFSVFALLALYTGLDLVFNVGQLTGILEAQTRVYSTNSQAIWTMAGARDVAHAQSFEPRLSIDSAAPTVLQNEVCSPTITSPVLANAYTCVANLSEEMATRLNATGNHTVVMRLFDPSSGAESPSSTPITIVSDPVVDPEPEPEPVTECVDGTAKYPVGAAKGERSQAGTQAFANRVAALRAAGWAVEWQRVQYAEPSPLTSAGNGFFYVIAICGGK